MECECQVSHTLAALGYGCHIASTMFPLPVPGPPLSRLGSGIIAVASPTALWSLLMPGYARCHSE
ncbi:hypothetical protein BDP81DRAFT_415943 [Colletotrichum phormii]|uniref:Uncharacterized protein n=1 Tax=Colletotrichum phormii TaxID=359342 RepID=A0AAJ0A140_9PEZI|nr:uncharacterized protein BDP81DRAFT_415943 [Colletotrichum phormii]KAK1654530.1 hypothetical protein BDP81DRAFT_415943 [Colletotrichum phormii]